jgi:hypothetical protein
VDEVFQAAPRMQNASQSQTPLGIATIPLTSFAVFTCCMVAQLIPPDLGWRSSRTLCTTVQHRARRYRLPSAQGHRQTRPNPLCVPRCWPQETWLPFPWWHYPGLVHRMPLDQQGLG